METAIETAKTSALSTEVKELPGVEMKDIILPIVMVRQNTYRKEHMKAFKPGDILAMPGGRPICKSGEGVEIVPLSITKQYRVLDITNPSDPKQLRYEPWSANKDWEFTDENGRKCRRDQCFAVFFIFREHLERQAELMDRAAKGEIVDPDDFALPVRITLTRAAFSGAGKVLNTHFELSRTLRQSPAAMTWVLKSKEMTNEKGNWYIFDAEKATKERKFTPKNLLAAADFWVKTLEAGNVKVAEEEPDVIDTEIVRDEASSQY